MKEGRPHTIFILFGFLPSQVQNTKFKGVKIIWDQCCYRATFLERYLLVLLYCCVFSLRTRNNFRAQFYRLIVSYCCLFNFYPYTSFSDGWKKIWKSKNVAGNSSNLYYPICTPSKKQSSRCQPMAIFDLPCRSVLDTRALLAYLIY